MTHLSQITGLLILWIMISAPGARAESLNFVIENEVYSKNIETTDLADETRVLDGHTPTGNILMSYFHYQINRRSSIDVGALISMPFGQDDQVLSVEPIISFTYYLRPTWWYTFGTIDRYHPVLDAFVDDIRAYDDRIEQGFQLQADNKVIRQDLWLDWRINEKSDRRENFTAGNYTQFKYKGFMVDAQILWFHFGGQRNTGGGVANNISSAIGAGYTFYPRRPSFLDNIGFSAHYLKVKNEPSATDIANGLIAEMNGFLNSDIEAEENGVLFKIFGSIKGVYFHYLYWDGGSREFISARGDPLYQVEKFHEFMLEKTWRLSDNAAVTANIQIQKLEDTTFYENLVSLEWRFDVPLFRQYFKDLRRQKKLEKNRKIKRKKIYQ